MFEHFKIQVDSYPSMPDSTQVILGRTKDSHVVRIGTVPNDEADDVLGSLERAIDYFLSCMEGRDPDRHHKDWKDLILLRGRHRILDGDFDPVS